jgi:fibronectin-binding autotransporter adhesin
MTTTQRTVRNTLAHQRAHTRKASLLAMAAGLALPLAAHAAVFTFAGACDANWSGTCATVNGCGAGINLNRNNWGLTACAPNSPPLPSAADDVFFPINGTINIGVSTRTITIQPAASVSITGSVGTSNGYLNRGVTNTTGAGNISYSGLFTNDVTGTFIEDGNTRFLNSVTFDNQGTLELRAVALSVNSGASSYTNSGTIRKTGVNPSSLNAPLTNNASIDVQAGDFNLNNTTYTGSPTSSITVSGANGADFFLNSCTLAGRLNASGAGEVTTTGTFTASGATILNASSNLRVLGNITAGTPADSFTNTGRVTTDTAGNISYAGTIANAGTGLWVENGNTRFHNSLSFTNNGILEWQGVNLAINAGASSYTNNNIIRKVGGGTTSINIPIFNNAQMQVQGGTLNMNSLTYTGAASNSINVSNGAAASFNTVTLAGQVNFTGTGTLTSTDTLTAGGSVTLNTTSPFRLFSNLTVPGGNSCTNQGLLSTSGAGNITYTGIITNGTGGTWIENGNTRFHNTASFVNNGIVELQAVALASNAGTNSWTNNATLRKTTTGASSTNIPTTNNGLIDVQQGTLDFNSTTYTGTASGNINVTSGAVASFNSMTLAGIVNFSGTGALTSTGTLTAAGNVVLDTTSAFRLFSNLTVTTGNSFTNQGLLTTSGAGNTTYSGIITNGNDGTWIENGNTRFHNSASFINNGIVELQGVALSANAGTNAWTNNATIRKTTTSGTSTTVPTTNNGLIDVQQGTLDFNGTTLTAAPASSFAIASTGGVGLNSMTVAGTVRGTGPGNIITSGTLAASGNVVFNTDAPTLLRSNLTANGANSFTNVGSLSSAGAGNLTYTGTLTNGPAGTWVEDGNTRFFNSVTLTNQGIFDIRGVNLTANAGASTITNASSGTIRKTVANTGTTNVPVTNNGLIDVQAGTLSMTGSFTQATSTGTLRARDAATFSSGTLNITGGRIEGRGTITATTAVSNVTIAPGDPAAPAGTLSFGNQLTMGSASTLLIDVRAVPSFASDRIQSNNQLAIAGTLRVVLDPIFTPILGDVYEIARSNSNQRTGTFSTLDIQSRPGIVFGVTYNSSSVLLTVLSTNCDSVDFNNDGLFPDSTDLDDFIAVLSGGPTQCSTFPTPGCSDVDFNNDGLFPDSSDLDSFLRRLSGGPC